MPQTIRPNATTTRTARGPHPIAVASVGSATPHECMDDATPSQSDYARCGANPEGDVVVIELGSPTNTPPNDRNHFVRCALQKDAAGKRSDCLVELRQGYTAESTGFGTLIASFNVIDIPTTMTRYRRRLTETEAARITDYTDLQLRLVPRCIKGVDGSAPVACRLVWAEVECPDLDESRTVRLSNAEQVARHRGATEANAFGLGYEVIP